MTHCATSVRLCDLIIGDALSHIATNLSDLKPTIFIILILIYSDGSQCIVKFIELVSNEGQFIMQKFQKKRYNDSTNAYKDR